MKTCIKKYNKWLNLKKIMKELQISNIYFKYFNSVDWYNTALPSQRPTNNLSCFIVCFSPTCLANQCAHWFPKEWTKEKIIT